MYATPLMATTKRRRPEASRLKQKRLALPDSPSQQWVANQISDRIGEVVGQQAVSYWETGVTDLRNVHPRKLRAYAAVLKITPQELAEYSGYPYRELFPDEPVAFAEGIGTEGAELPVYAVSTAGDPHAPPVDPSYRVLPEDLRPHTRLFQLDSDEMLRDGRGLPVGTTLYVDLADTRLEANRVYLVVAHGVGHVRRYVELRSGPAFVAENPDRNHADIPLDEAQIVGLVYDAYSRILL